MIHFAASDFDRPKAATPVVPPLTPAAYLRLRRTAAGMTMRAVASRIAKPADSAEATALVALLETPGNLARRRETLDALRGAFRFDPDVYRQLASDPVEHHPQICRGCGCSAWDPHVDAQGVEALEWASDSLCTSCADAKALSTGRLR